MHLINYCLSPTGYKKFGERWSTNKNVIGVNVDPHKLTFSDYISTLRGCWHLKFLHALEIHQGLLAHTKSGVGSPQNFKGEKLKNWLEILRIYAYNFGATGSKLTKPYHGM